ncbi:MAG: MerR family transcriptional regulator [Firmicutes bacterium]|nr:MerR family transcriptional regulator [Bacillota bacterium]
MGLKVKEVADMVGISVRTLHHYHAIGLLIPDGVSKAGYRLYSSANLRELQQILFFKEMGLPLNTIKDIVQSPHFNEEEALLMHRKMLMEKRCRLDKMLENLDKTIQHRKGKRAMTNKERFEGFNHRDNPYEAEARKRWGDAAVDKANAKLNELSEKERANLPESMDTIYAKLATLRHKPPASEAAQMAIKEWYDFLNQNFGDYYTPEIFKNLGQMYVDDPRFTKNIDKFGEGLAVFMRDAMQIFANSHHHNNPS